MKREIGLIGGVALVSGTMIGSGIFMSPQFVLSYVGSPGASLVISALSGLVAMCAALCYSELGTIIPESGGEFIYILRIYGPLPAFFAAFTFIIVVRPMGIAAMGFSIAEYVLSIVYPDSHPPPLLLKFTAASIILVVALVNTWNVQAAIRVQVVFLVAKVLALTVIVIGGFVRIFQSSSIFVSRHRVLSQCCRDGVLSGAVVIRWLVQLELRHRGAQKTRGEKCIDYIRLFLVM